MYNLSFGLRDKNKAIKMLLVCKNREVRVRAAGVLTLLTTTSSYCICHDFARALNTPLPWQQIPCHNTLVNVRTTSGW